LIRQAIGKPVLPDLFGAAKCDENGEIGALIDHDRRVGIDASAYLREPACVEVAHCVPDLYRRPNIFRCPTRPELLAFRQAAHLQLGWAMKDELPDHVADFSGEGE
jgi:hypothetical protein|tara:strand:+ start:4167 stop:4484 length:318 start_codon:yes stop_codon:yes gene_type:complete